MTAALPEPGQLLDDAPCGHLVAGPDGRILSVNATLCRWLGTSREDLLAKRFTDLLSMGGRIFHQTHLAPLLRMQGSVGEVKLDLRCADGTFRPVLLNVLERPHEGRMLLHAAVFVADDRHKYETELLAQRRRAVELADLHARDQQEIAGARAQAEDRALFAEQLVGVVSHDIRNPLAVIQMSAALLQRELSPQQREPVVARIDRATRRMQRLIDDLLDFTQARLGQGLKVEPVDGDLHQVATEAVAELAVAFPGSTIRHTREGSGPCRIDPDRLVQVIGNLVANAVAHGDSGRPITVRTTCATNACELSVHNHGEPIPAAAQRRLFEPMVRGEDKVSGGVGLGLYIVREIVRAHGGTVEVRSAPESGTTFVVTLPAGSRTAS